MSENQFEPYTVTLQPSAALIEKDQSRADTVRQRLQQLDSTVTLNEYEQADLWAEVKAENYWMDWKFESFDHYMKDSNIDLSKREVAYRIQVSVVSKLLGVSLLQKSRAKMSKLKLIYQLEPSKIYTDSATLKEEKGEDIMRDLVETAPGKTIKEIAEIVKRLKGTTEEPASELTWMNLPVRRDKKQIVTAAIEVAQKLNGTTIDALTKEDKDISQADALEKVCADFIADPNNQVDEFSDDSDQQFEDEVISEDFIDEDEDVNA